MPESITDIAQLLHQRLAAARQVANLVAGRIRPDVLPASEKMPAIRYELVSTNSQHHLAGASGYAFSRVQFDCYGRTRAVAAEVAKQVKDVLHGFYGTLGDTIRVDDCMLDNEYDRTDPPSPGSSNWRYRRTLDFRISHTEPIPSLVID